jgi:hypothetical protein
LKLEDRRAEHVAGEYGMEHWIEAKGEKLAVDMYKLFVVVVVDNAEASSATPRTMSDVGNSAG